MNKSEEYLIGCEHDGSFIPMNEVLRLLKIAQIDAVDATVLKLIEEVDLIELDGVPYGIDGISAYRIGEQLKKELK